jgi:23S rRNA pseudouridine2605 synthase
LLISNYAEIQSKKTAEIMMNSRDRQDKRGPKRPAAKTFVRSDKKQDKAPGAKADAALKPTETMRLNRYISNAGICSRRDADALITKGLITVNGKVVTEMGTQVKFNDDVRYQDKKLNPEKKVYVLLNKPKDTVTTATDPEGRITVMDIIAGACTERVYPVGRLDRATTGVLLLTNDGDLSKKLTHPSSGCRKIYHVYTDKPVTQNHLTQMAEGIELEDGIIIADAVSYADASDKKQVGIEIHSGRNRVVRRIFEQLGYHVEKLDRVYFSGLTKKGIARGKWRFLTADEIKFLKAGIMK